MTAPGLERHLAALYDLIHFCSGLKEADADKVCSRAADKLREALGAQAATYYAYLPDKRQLMPRLVLGPAAEDICRTAVDIRTGICGWAAAHRKAVLVEDAYKDKRFLPEVDALTGFRTRTVLAVPFGDGRGLAGVMEFINKRAGSFTDEDLRLVEAACRLTALALRNV